MANARPLHFFDAFQHERLTDIREAAWWLKTPFGAARMIAEFGPKKRVEVNFNVALPGGELLTSRRHEELLTDIYDFICVQTHPLVTGKRKRDNAACHRRVVRALHIIDYLLLNAEPLRLDKFGLRSIIGSDLKKFLIALSSRSHIANSIYGWDSRLAAHLKEEGKKLGNEDFEIAIEEQPALASIHIEDKDFSLTGINRDEILRGRAAIYLAGGYIRASSSTPYRFAPSNRKLSEIFYTNTLLGVNLHKTVLDELCLAPLDSYVREYPAVPVRTASSDDIFSEKTFSFYKNVLLSFMPLSEIGIGIPEKSLKDLSEQRLSDVLKLKDIGRFRTVPPDYIIHVLRAAIDFFYSHGEHLLRSYVSILKEAKRNGVSVQEFVAKNSITPFLTEETRALGVKYWSLRWQMTQVENQAKKKSKLGRSSSEFFARMRQEKQGLMELVHAQFGAMQLIVGTLMAARHEELADLPLDCMDESSTWLNLLSRKSGYGDLRRMDARPIPVVAVDVIERIQALHRTLQDEKLDCAENIFETPSTRGGFFRSIYYFNFCIDVFLDFIDAPLTKDGHRYYIRQHQLRRAFAMLFFVSCGFAGMDTLRWFLRHLDPEHLYHYLSESTPGVVLRTMKSIAVTLMVRDGRKECANLADFVQKRFGVSAFEIIDEKAFEKYVDYLDKLQEDNSIEIEPVFFQSGEDKDCKLGIIVWGDDEI